MTNSLISNSELATKLSTNAPATVVFDCRFSLMDFEAGRQLFESGHIPGAFHLDMEADLAGEKTGTNGRHPLPTKEQFESTLRKAGVNNDTEIILYDDNKFAGAARAWWLLRYFGHEDVQILDSGLAGWIAADRPTATGAASPCTPGRIVLNAGKSGMLIETAAMKTIVTEQSRTIIDSREPERFAGLQEPIDPTAGRIPGAKNAPWQTVTDNDGHAFEHAEQVQRWHTIGAGEVPIVYCGSGVTACVNLLSRELAGLPMGAMYPGGWSEWCALSDVAWENDRQTPPEQS